MTLKVVPFIAMSDAINNMSRGNALAPNRHNTIPCTGLGLPDKGCTIKGLVVCYVGMARLYDLWD